MIQPVVLYFALSIAFVPWEASGNDLSDQETSASYLGGLLSIGAPTLQKGRNKFPVTVEFHKDGKHEAEYLALLSVDGLPSTPFSLTLSGGAITVRETFVWSVTLCEAAASIRFILLGFNITSNTVHKMVDITRTYQVIDSIPAMQLHVVVKADNLTKISEIYYGTPRNWRQIYEVNRITIGANPNFIRPGMELAIPRGESSTKLGPLSNLECSA